MKPNSGLFLFGAIHELSHARGCQLVRVQVRKLNLSDSSSRYPRIEFEPSNLMDELIIRLFPLFFEWLLGLQYLKGAGYLRVLWLKLHVKSVAKFWANAFLSELRELRSA